MRLPSRLTRFLFHRLVERFLLASHKPDFVVGEAEDPYLRRWHVIGRNRWLNVYFHQFLRSDDDRALHDHPWVNMSIVLAGSYVEVVPTRGATVRRIERMPGAVVVRSARAAHRVEMAADKACYTLFITGPKVRSWGFWCDRGWIHWREFTAGPKGEVVGRGCGENTP